MSPRRTRPGRIAAALACAALSLGVGAAPGARREEAGLARARELFGQNRWSQARTHLREHWSSLSPEERPVARFIIGRSWVREAELYHEVRTFANEVGLDYLEELAKDEANREVPWLPLFTGLYQLAAGQPEAAERSLSEAASLRALPDSWKSVAERRRAVARHRRGVAQGTRLLAGDASHEGRYWRLVLTDSTNGTKPDTAPRAWDRLWIAPVLLREGRDQEAEAMLSDLDPDLPAVEYDGDSTKVLRFFDPLALEALERVLWERAVLSLRPVATKADGAEGALSALYAGLSLYRLGRGEEARSLLRSAATASSIGEHGRARARLLLAATSLDGKRPSPAHLAELWKGTRADREAVLLWAELGSDSFSDLEPFASSLPARLEEIGEAFSGRKDRAVAGRWGLARLRGGADPAEMVSRLSRLRDNANKNKIERNDPLLLLALAVANYRNAAYAQALETLFALSEVFPGLRGLHWNLQGTYAARQRAGGEARISQ